MKIFRSSALFWVLNLLVGLFATTSSIYGQAACSATVATTNVTCPGGKDGTVDIIPYGPNGKVQSGLCRAPIPAPFTCSTIGCTRTISTNADFTLNDGEVACVQVANFNKNITFNGGGHLVFCGAAAPMNINFNGNILTCRITVMSGANVSFTNFNNVGNSILQNYGTITFNNGTGYNGVLENNGTIIITNTANINSTKGSFTNNGTITIQGSFNIFNTLENYGTITVSQDLNVNTQSGFKNFCTLSVTGNMMINPTNNGTIPNAVENYGKITITNQTVLNGSAQIGLFDGSQWQTKVLTVNGPIIGPSSPSCALMNVVSGGQISINSSGGFSGGVSLCYPTNVTKTGTVPASTCNTCTVSDPPTITWTTPVTVVGKTKYAGLAAGSYSVKVKIPGCNFGASGDVLTKTFTITQPNPIVITESFSGTLATLAVTGGTPFSSGSTYKYFWADGTTEPSHVLAPKQSMVVKVTDSKGCNTTKTITNVNSCSVNMTLTPTDIACASLNTGRIDVAVSGITGYELYMNGSKVVSPITNLPEGEYTVILKKGTCETSATTKINISSTALKVDIIPIGDQALVSPSGGTAPYKYLWDDGDTNQLKPLIEGKTYTVKVTDAVGCPVSKTITKPPGFCFNILIIKQEVRCGDTAPATAEAVVSGGSGNYSFLWSYMNATTAKVTGLPVGTHSVTVTDNGKNPVCKVIASIQISNIGSTLVVDHGMSGNVVTIFPSGSTGPYTYTWKHGPTTQTVTLPSFGTYEVLVTDSKGCPVPHTVEYNKDCDFKIEPIISSNNVRISVKGGVAPFTFKWSHNPIEKGDQLNGLPPGTYTVTVREASDRHCEQSRTFTIPDCNKSISFSSINPSCPKNNSCSGSATVIVSPATGVSYLWSNGQTGTSATALCTGTQWVEIKDPTCATVRKEVSIASGTCGTPVCTYDLAVTKVKHLSCFENHDAFIDISITGKPNGTLSFRWQYADGTLHDSPTEDLVVPTPGHYVLTATDSKGGCMRTAVADVAGASSRLSSTASSSSLSCFGAKGNISVSPSGGLSPYSITWSGSTSTSFSRTSLPAGNYSYIVKDANGCPTSGTAKLTEPSQTTPDITTNSYKICADVSPAIPVKLTAESLPGYTYNWTKEGDASFVISGNEISVTQAGTYTVTLTQSGCGALSASQTISSENCNVPSEVCNNTYITIEDIGEPVDPCTEHIRVVYANAVNRYKAYIELEKKQFKEKYIEKCLASLNEQLSVSYDIREYHNTLYYYDQVGNLVKTVPPAGVVPLTDSEIDKVIEEKGTSAKTVFTRHTYETTHQYNTLNAQINEDMPDHNRQPIWELSSAGGNIPNTANIEASYMADDTKGFLISNEGNAGYIYTSTNGGLDWGKLAKVGIPNLYDVQWVNTTQAVAVGSEGTFVETSDAGMSWKYRALPGMKELRKVAYNATGNQGYIFDANGNYYLISYTAPNWNIGVINTSLATITGNANVRDVHIVDANKVYVITDGANGTSNIYFNSTASSGGTWGLRNSVTMPATTAVGAKGNDVATVASVYGGNYLQVSSNAGQTWKYLSTDVPISTSASKLVLEGNTAISLVAGGQLYRYNPLKAYNFVIQTPFTSPTTVVGIAPAGTKLFAVGSNGTVVSASSSSNTWSTPSASLMTTPQGINFYNDQIGTVYGNKLFTTNNAGGSWGTDLLASTNIAGTTNKITTTLSYAYFSTKDQGVVLTGTNLYKRAPNPSTLEWTLLYGNVSLISFDPSSNLLGCFVNSAGQIYTSINAGQSWTPLSSLTVTTTLVSQMKQLAYSNGNIYITLTGGGVLVGTSSGWFRNNASVAIPALNGIDVASNNIGYAVGNNGMVLKTTNAGTSWQIVPNSITSHITDVAQNANNYFVSDQSGALYKNTHTGIASLVESVSGNSPELSLNGTQLAVVSNAGIIASTTDGAAIAPLKSSTTDQPINIRSVSVNATTPNGQILMVGDNGVIYSNTVANTGNHTNRGVNVLESLNDASMERGTGTGYVVGNKGTIIKTTDGGSTWRTQTINTSLNPIPDLTATSSQGNYAVAVGKSGFVVETSTGNAPWQVQTVSGTGVTANLNDVATLNGLSLAVGESSSVFRKNGTSASWAKLSVPTATLPAGTSLQSVAFADLTWAFMAGANGIIIRTKDANAATPTWAKLEKSSGVNWTTATIKVLYFKDRFTGYAFCDNGSVLKTTDGGDRWTQDSQKSLNTTASVNSVATSPSTGELLIAGASGTSLHLLDESDLFSTRYWYDEIGRLVVSQDAKQFSTNAYSYNIYDALNRIIEVGQVQMTDANKIDRADFAAGKSYIFYNVFKDNWLKLGTKSQITKSYYSTQKYTIPNFSQENLRKRIASVTFQENESSTYDHATHYSYDEHGNVKRLVQDNPMLAANNRQYVYFEYDYDLVSGKVNQLAYQPGQVDALYHRYQYDADNRITLVETSKDGLHWSKEADYVFYAHGPLARMTIGADAVQMMDYAYTLQGWIKSVNGAQFGYALGYYRTDYSPISGSGNGTLTTPTVKRLYNGNIATITSQTATPVATWNNAAITQQFEYDQLHRLLNTSVLNGGNNYKTSYTYDANGNIRSLSRYNETGIQFDALSYKYEETGNNLGSNPYSRNTNKLRWVDDTTAFANVLQTEDIEDQVVENYQYDNIGQLVANQQDTIQSIEWTPYHKVKKIIRRPGSNMPDIEFAYDAMQHRISKIVKPKVAGALVTDPKLWQYTYYSRDAQGNVLSIYTQKEGQAFTLAEQHLYGSSRLGMINPNLNLTTPPTSIQQTQKGIRQYELTDHLGDVRLVINDRKMATNQGEVQAAYDYYAFGMQMPKRLFNSQTYRYGYNGMEKDNEINVEGGSYTTEFRQYDGRLGKWLSIDPVYKSHESPFCAFSNSPFMLVDPKGADPEPSKEVDRITTPVEVDFSLKFQFKLGGGIKQLKLGDALDLTAEGSLGEVGFEVTEHEASLAGPNAEIKLNILNVSNAGASVTTLEAVEGFTEGTTGLTLVKGTMNMGVKNVFDVSAEGAMLEANEKEGIVHDMSGDSKIKIGPKAVNLSTDGEKTVFAVKISTPIVDFGVSIKEKKTEVLDSSPIPVEMMLTPEQRDYFRNAGLLPPKPIPTTEWAPLGPHGPKYQMYDPSKETE